MDNVDEKNPEKVKPIHEWPDFHNENELNAPTVKERMEDFEKFVEEQKKLLLGKGADYTGGKAGVDAYSNFRIIADLLKGCPITPYTVCLIYEMKHLLSLITFAKTGRQESGEGLRGRHLDRGNYVFIEDQLVNDHLEYFKEKE